MLSGWFSVEPLNLILPVVLATALAVLLLPRDSGRRGAVPSVRLDERDTMFSRAELVPGSSAYEQYYRLHPEQRERDDAIRALPGLLAPGTSQYNSQLFAATAALLAEIAELRGRVDGVSAVVRSEISATAASDLVRGWASDSGAVNCGITRLRDYHFYSVAGRGHFYGEPVSSLHSHALIVAVEMDRAMLATAPAAPVILESHRRYFQSGRLAVEIADSIRQLGYSARAHIDGCYQVVCPLVARDAGLGDLGRMGLLMTPRHGPRVRLAVVTTDLPLAESPATGASGVTDFCLNCRKCVTACPAGAIPDGDPEEVAGVVRWRINSEACYEFWCRAGTDCGRCISVCPWSHPDNPLHNLVRSGVRRSPLFRRLAIRLDDLFYGRLPAAKPFPPALRSQMRPPPECDT